MGAGILMSRTQANAAMAAARARNNGCGPCGGPGTPPSPTNGGVTGRQPATGPSPTGGQPNARQDELHPRMPAGQVAKDTGNNPCGGNGNSSSNIGNQGYTSNPDIIPVSQSNLNSQPTNPYQQNPLEQPTTATGGQPATDGNGFPTNAAQDGGCNCGDAGQPDYETGYECGQQLYFGGDASQCPDQRTNGAEYARGFNDGMSNRRYSPGPNTGRRSLNKYNTRTNPRLNNLRRGIRRYI